MSLTHTQIWTTAYYLEAAGMESTLAAVRKALSGGRYSRLSDAMAEQRTRLTIVGRCAKEPLPPAPNPVRRALGPTGLGICHNCNMPTIS